MFIDEAKIYVKAGDGGRGIVSFRREKYVPRGGPDGGDGGRGGDVILRANPHMRTLMDYRYRRHYRAESGKPGGSGKKSGRSGQACILEVPCGTVVYEAESGRKIGEVVLPGSELIVAHGGHGGRGNAAFARPNQRAPRCAEPGEPGEERWIRLELKLLADVGLVGFPNAGKSSLLRKISRAKPRVADYPFTTLHPHLGVVRYAPGKSFVVADIPGLTKGAHRGKGLGLRFLRHIERTQLLLFVLDPLSIIDLVQQFEILQHELRMYHPALLQKPLLVAITKADCLDEEQRDYCTQQTFQGIKPLLISSITGAGIDQLLHRIHAELTTPARAIAGEDPVPEWNREEKVEKSHEEGERKEDVTAR